MSEQASTAGGMVTSGLIASTIGGVMTVVLSLVMPYPWDLSRTIVCVVIASFVSAAVGFQKGLAIGRSEPDKQ